MSESQKKKMRELWANPEWREKNIEKVSRGSRTFFKVRAEKIQKMLENFQSQEKGKSFSSKGSKITKRHWRIFRVRANYPVFFCFSASEGEKEFDPGMRLPPERKNKRITAGILIGEDIGIFTGDVDAEKFEQWKKEIENMGVEVEIPEKRKIERENETEERKTPLYV